MLAQVDDINAIMRLKVKKISVKNWYLFYICQEGSEGLNCACAKSLKKDLAYIKKKLTPSEVKLDSVGQELADIKRKLGKHSTYKCVSELTSSKMLGVQEKNLA